MSELRDLALPTTMTPTDPAALYLRQQFCNFWYGPFSTLDEARFAARLIKRADDALWDAFCVQYGNPTATGLDDYVFVTPEQRAWVLDE